MKEIVSTRAWDISFQTGAATFSGQSQKDLEALLSDLVVASGTLVEIHGHTDANGDAEANMRLSEEGPAPWRRGRSGVISRT